MAIGAIAKVRHIQRDSVESYLAEAIQAGTPYDWHRLGVPRATLVSVAAQAAAALAATKSGNGCSTASGSDAQACATGGDCSLGSMARQRAGNRACMEGSGVPLAGAGAEGLRHAACAVNADLAGQLQAAGVTVKALKERLQPEAARHGQIRLALAHIGRLGLLPELLAEAQEAGSLLNITRKAVLLPL